MSDLRFVPYLIENGGLSTLIYMEDTRATVSYAYEVAGKYSRRLDEAGKEFLARLDDAIQRIDYQIHELKEDMEGPFADIYFQQLLITYVRKLRKLQNIYSMKPYLEFDDLEPVMDLEAEILKYTNHKGEK